MKTKCGLQAIVLAMASVCVAFGCVPQNPTVVTTPGPTTIVHDRPTRAPDVTIVNPPAAAPDPAPSTHTETNTTTTNPAPTPDTGGAPSTSTSTTTTGTGG